MNESDQLEFQEEANPRRGIWRTFFALSVIVVSLFASSWFFFPVSTVNVSGTKNLKPKEVAKMAGVAPGNPWLWVSAARAGELEQNPLVRRAEIVKRFPGVVEIKLQERAPLAVWKRGGVLQTLAEDGTVLPTMNAKLILEGELTSRLPEALLVARVAKDLGAQRVKFDASGFWLEFGGGLWVDSYASLLKYGRNVKMLVERSPKTKVNVYDWGVSASSERLRETRTTQ
jgi:cell division protein FtsQ